MLQLMQQANVFKKREQKLKEEVTYCAGQFEDEEDIYEVDVSTDTEELGTEQYYSKDSSNVLLAQLQRGDFVRLQTDFYQKDGECKGILTIFLRSHAYHIPHYIHYCYCQQVL